MQERCCVDLGTLTMRVGLAETDNAPLECRAPPADRKQKLAYGEREVGVLTASQEVALSGALSADAVERYRRNFQDELDSAAQYRAMAESERDARVAEIYRELAVIEEKHAAFWEERLRRANAKVPERAPSWRARVLSFVARRFGAQAVLPTIATREYKDRDVYRGQPETQGTKMVAQEWSHARVLQSILMQRASGAPGEE